MAAELPSCPVCRTPHNLAARFCLGCRLEFATGLRPQPPFLVPFRGRRWELHIDADRDYYDSLPQDPDFPAEPRPTQVIPLHAATVVVGFRRGSVRLPAQTELVEPPPDPGISTFHAQLDRQPDGRYLLRDPGSLNGIRLGPGRPRLARQDVIPLNEHDRFFLGSWTRITVRRRTEPPSPPSPQGRTRTAQA
ncbi:FHA domain-containing protein [Parafrankia elaeagni]|uniref:FHA domain-containing protein n=1 Tax=Parafrankia elaeagni TaxID=222534 RepID=UPI00037B5E42|nr:FHA domain-containing protein [Parafrankia elaeagni]